jgi:hypothetical protein
MRGWISMKNYEYCRAFTETLYILEHIKTEDKNRIPKKFLDFLNRNSSKIYKPNFDCSKRLKDLNLNPKTIGILDLINNKYFK